MGILLASIFALSADEMNDSESGDRTWLDVKESLDIRDYPGIKSRCVYYRADPPLSTNHPTSQLDELPLRFDQMPNLLLRNLPSEELAINSDRLGVCCENMEKSWPLRDCAIKTLFGCRVFLKGCRSNSNACRHQIQVLAKCCCVP